MQLEREEYLGARHYERKDTRPEYTNGYKPKKLHCELETLTYSFPKPLVTTILCSILKHLNPDSDLPNSLIVLIVQIKLQNQYFLQKVPAFHNFNTEINVYQRM